MKKKSRIFGTALLFVFAFFSTHSDVFAQATAPSSTKVSPPNSQEKTDSARLIDAVNAGDIQAALGILRAYGMADSALMAMGSRLGKAASPVELEEPFLKGSLGAWAVGGRAIKTNLQANLEAITATLGYERPVWIPRHLDLKALTDYNADLLQAPLAPIGVLDVKSNDACFIRWFMWFDRYGDYLHSVAINGVNLSNARLDESNYGQANHMLNAMFQLVKARKPDAFVWLRVVKQDNLSDEKWLKAMTFKPDGLQIANLRQFHSPFAQTRARFVKIVGTNMPMVIEDFFGYTAAVQEKKTMLLTAVANTNFQARQVAESTASQQLGGIGEVVGYDLALEETNLQSLGYRGITVEWALLTALANSTNAPVNKSELVDPRTGLLDVYFEQKDFSNMLSLATSMVSDSAPGDLTWVVGKLYQGIALLSQPSPKLSTAVEPLDEVLAFDFSDRFGRDHYILGAAKWRIYAAALTGDREKIKALVQWASNQNFRPDLKEDFMKQYRTSAALQPASN